MEKAFARMNLRKTLIHRNVNFISCLLWKIVRFFLLPCLIITFRSIIDLNICIKIIIYRCKQHRYVDIPRLRIFYFIRRIPEYLFVLDISEGLVRALLGNSRMRQLKPRSHEPRMKRFLKKSRDQDAAFKCQFERCRPVIRSCYTAKIK